MPNTLQRYRYRAAPDLPTDNLLAEWRFDERAGGNVRECRNGFHGTVIGSAVWDNQGLTFAGAGRVDCGNPAGLLVSTGISVGFVFKTTQIPGTSRDIVRHNSHFIAVQYFTSAGQVRCIRWNTSNVLAVATCTTFTAGTYANGAWHHCIATYDTSAGLAFYIDTMTTALVTNAVTGAMQTNTTAPWVFGSAEDGTEAWSGSLAFVYVYGRALTSTERTTVHTALKSYLAQRGISLP